MTCLVTPRHCVVMTSGVPKRPYFSQHVIQLQIQQDELHASKERLEIDGLKVREQILADLRSNHSKHLLEVERVWQEKVTMLESELHEVKNDVKILQIKLATTLRSRVLAKARARRSRGLESLARGNGNMKKRVLQLCQLLGGLKMMEETQHENKMSKKRKPLWSDNSIQFATARALARILSKTEATSMVDTTKFNGVTNQLVDNTLQKIGSSIDLEAILASCNMTRVSQRSYREIYKTVKGRISLANKKLKATIYQNHIRYKGLFFSVPSLLLFDCSHY